VGVVDAGHNESQKELDINPRNSKLSPGPADAMLLQWRFVGAEAAWPIAATL